MTIRINLLPYREEKKLEARRQFIVLMLGVAGLSVAAWMLVHGILAGHVNIQEGRNSVLGSEISKLDKEIEEINSLKSEIDALKSRKSVIESLQFERASAVQIMDQMVRLTPEGVYLKSVKQDGSVVNVTGHSMSNDLVSEFMTAISNSKYIESPVLVEIKAAKEGERRVGEFSLNFSIAKPKEEVAAPSNTKKKQ